MKRGEHPASRQNLIQARNTPRPRISAVMQSRMLALLVEGEISSDELKKQTGLHITTIRYYLRALHRPAEGQNLIYICAWTGRSNTMREWKWGPGMKDVPQPKIDLNRKNREYRARQRDVKLLGLAGRV